MIYIYTDTTVRFCFQFIGYVMNRQTKQILENNNSLKVCTIVQFVYILYIDYSGKFLMMFLFFYLQGNSKNGSYSGTVDLKKKIIYAKYINISKINQFNKRLYVTKHLKYSLLAKFLIKKKTEFRKCVFKILSGLWSDFCHICLYVYQDSGVISVICMYTIT